MTVWVHRALAMWAMLIGVAACDDAGVELIVDLKTDLVPGLEFARVRTEYVVAAGTPREATIAVLGDEDFIEGQRVAEFRDLARGEASVRVALVDRAGAEVLVRSFSARIERTYALTAVLTRSCRDVSCPEAGGDPDRTTCLAGRCISPACAADPADCPAQCDADAQCTASVACAVGVCIDGSCFEAGLHERCQDDEFCDPDVGCVPRGPVLDGGVCEATMETNCADGEDDDCDGAPDCADPECATRACNDGNAATTGEACSLRGFCEGPPPDCNDGNDCTTDSFDDELGCVHTPGGTTCDDGFYCNGSDTCSGASCVVHAGNPCASTCNEVAESCEPCLRDADCGEPIFEAWSECGFAPGCGADGERTRRVWMPTCRSGTCDLTERIEPGACSRDPEGAACGDPMPGEWGPCEAADPCATDGTQRRVVIDRICTAGTCGDSMREETQACTRPAAPNGTSCGGDPYDVCCGGVCTRVRADAHCGGCNLACPGGTSCAATGTGGYACRGCSSNDQCQTFVGPASTCYDVTAPPAFCNCQSRCGVTCVEADAGCGPGMYCHMVSGHNWCAPFP